MSLEQHPQTGLGAILDQRIAHLFGVQEDAVLIANNEHPVYRAGDIIIRQESDPEEAVFFASLFSSITARGFRVARPITSISGAYVTDDGWTAGAFSARMRQRRALSVSGLTMARVAADRPPRGP